MKLPLSRVILALSVVIIIIFCSNNVNYSREVEYDKVVFNYKDLGVISSTGNKVFSDSPNIETNVIDQESEVFLNKTEKLLEVFQNGIDDYLKILSCKNDKIILSNFNNILTLKNNGKYFEVYNLLDLRKLTSDQISDKSEGFLSPNNNYFIYSNINENENKKSIYFCDLLNNKGLQIGVHNIIDVVDDWSSNSNFYVYADKEGNNIYIFDVLKNAVKEIEFNKGIIKEMYITDDGNLYVKGNKKHYLSKDSDYDISEVIIPGTLLGCTGEELIYYDAGIIYKYDKGKTEQVGEVGKGYNLITNDCNKAIFSNENNTIIYDYENNSINKYGFKYEYLTYLTTNHSGDKCLINSDRHNPRVVGSNGQYYRIDYSLLSDFIGNSKWFNDKYLLKIQFDDTTKKFSIIKLNVEDARMNILFKNNSSGN